jgi:hypothetical protein
MHDLECILNSMQVFSTIKLLIEYNASEKRTWGFNKVENFSLFPSELDSNSYDPLQVTQIARNDHNGHMVVRFFV